MLEVCGQAGGGGWEGLRAEETFEGGGEFLAVVLGHVPVAVHAAALIFATCRLLAGFDIMRDLCVKSVLKDWR